jgi:regulator of protease activity HflC (stomatin/prohibitin superfamily)
MNPIINLALVVLVTLTGMLAMLASIRKIPPGYRGVLFRFGRLVKELPSGTAWVLPLIDSVMLVDLGEQTIALPDELTLTVGDKQYNVEGSFSCKIVAPIPAVMAAMQAQKDLAVVVGERLLDEIKRLGALAAMERPEHAQQWALESLNQNMSPAWQVKFTKLELRFVLT